MSWAWVKEIKNQTSYYKFNYLERGITDTDVAAGRISLSSYRGTVTNPNELFLLIKSYLESLYQQEAQGTYNAVHDPDTVYEQFLYGKTGGTGMKMKLTRTDASPTVYAFANDCYRYLSFSSYNLILNSTGNTGWADSGNYYDAFAGYGMIINTDTEEMYLVFMFGNMKHYQSSHLPAYYDNAQLTIDIAYNNGNGNLWSIFHDSIPGGGGSDPYGDDDYTEPVGGDPDPEVPTETIDEPALPVVSASTSGFCTAFVPTIGQINSLANFLISPTWYQVFGSPVLGGFKDLILGLQVFPCTIPKETTPEDVKIYWLGGSVSTGVLMPKATNQFVEISCGSVEIKEHWGNCCDYNPYTTIGIFLPFCGYYDLDTDDVMGKTLTVSYRIDILSGSCLATIKVDGSVMYQYSGSCSAQIPISSGSYDDFMNNMIQLGIATATGGAGLAAAGSALDVSMVRSAELGKKNSKLAAKTAVAAHDNYESARVGIESSVGGAAINAVISGKGHYKHAGALGSSVGFLGVRKPYLIIKRPVQQIPSMYGPLHGYPSFTSATLEDLEGFTVVDDIRLNIPEATVEEILECEKLLKEGVIL